LCDYFNFTDLSFKLHKATGNMQICGRSNSKMQILTQILYHPTLILNLTIILLTLTLAPFLTLTLGRTTELYSASLGLLTLWQIKLNVRWLCGVVVRLSDSRLAVVGSNPGHGIAGFF